LRWRKILPQGVKAAKWTRPANLSRTLANGIESAAGFPEILLNPPLLEACQSPLHEGLPMEKY